MLVCGNTGGIAGGELCGLCRVHGCEGYKIYKKNHLSSDESKETKLQNLLAVSLSTLIEMTLSTLFVTLIRFVLMRIRSALGL